MSAAILPVVQKQHQLLVTLLLCNAAAMEVTKLQLPFVKVIKLGVVACLIIGLLMLRLSLVLGERRR